METTNIQIVGRDSSGSFSSADIQKIDKAFFNSSGTLTGLNVYQIQPKIKALHFHGFTSVQNNLLSPVYNTNGYNSYNWGLGNTLAKSYWVHAQSFARTIYYEYIDTCGNERSSQMNVSAGVITPLKLAGNIDSSFACINKVKVSPVINGDFGVRVVHSTSDISNNTAVFLSYNTEMYLALMCPNNAIMKVDSMCIMAYATIDIVIYKHKSDGTRTAVGYYKAQNNNYTFCTADKDGSLCGYFYPGETITMINATGGAQVYIDAQLSVQYF